MPAPSPNSFRGSAWISRPPTGPTASGNSCVVNPRGRLFQEYARILEEARPRGFLLENVGGLLGAQGGRAWREVREVFASLGYRLFWRVLDAADYGVPQHRERLFLVGLREGEFRFPRPTHGPDSPGAVPYRTPREALQGVDSASIRRYSASKVRFSTHSWASIRRYSASRPRFSAHSRTRS